MIIEKKFAKNYLSQFHYKNGWGVAFISIFSVYLMSWIYWSDHFEWGKYLNANFKLVIDQVQIWRLFTTSFIHANLEHLLANTSMLFILLFLVTSYYGYFFSVILGFTIGIATNLIVILTYQGDVNLVGASGVIYYLWGFSLAMYFFISKQMSFIKKTIRVIGVFLILLVPTSFNPTTSYLAHYIGFLFGVMVAYFYYGFNKQRFSKHLEYEYYVVEDYESENMATNQVEIQN